MTESATSVDRIVFMAITPCSTEARGRVVPWFDPGRCCVGNNDRHHLIVCSYFGASPDRFPSYHPEPHSADGSFGVMPGQRCAPIAGKRSTEAERLPYRTDS